jgi:hypothetical protein
MQGGYQVNDCDRVRTSVNETGRVIDPCPCPLPKRKERGTPTDPGQRVKAWLNVLKG